MALYESTRINLGQPAFRLLRLLKGKYADLLQCELFVGQLPDGKNGENNIHYEALSYTWGSPYRRAEITVNGCIMSVTENLYAALLHLRARSTDRVLWVDAICIDQSNLQERSHQVQQMGKIYTKAKQVIIWLGEATKETNTTMASMQLWQKGGLKSYWRILTSFWCDGRCTGYRRIYKCWYIYQRALLIGYQTLLERSWFRRVWILQEVANAQAAIVVCGNKSVSANTFARFPVVFELQPSRHCQAVLDIMPGLSRKESWWSQKRDLRTLLRKFSQSEASDPRDKIYALLDISLDVRKSKGISPDYTKDLRQVIQDTVLFLLSHTNSDRLRHLIPNWGLPAFMENLDLLSNVVLREASMNGYEKEVKLLLGRADLDVNLKDSEGGRTPLLHAAERGHGAVIKMLLEREDVDVNLADYYGRTPLYWAAKEGYEAIVKLLLERADVDINSADGFYQTPLYWAAKEGHEAVVKLLLERADVKINLANGSRGTPLSHAAERGHGAVIKMLLEREDIDVNLAGYHSLTPLCWAVKEGHEAVVKLLLERADVDINSADDFHQTPLLYAAIHGYKAVVELLLKTGKADINAEDGYGKTPLYRAVEGRHEAVVRLLLENDSKIKGRRKLLSLAKEIGHEGIYTLLLDRTSLDERKSGVLD